MERELNNLERILVVLTCFNRCKKTVNCIKSIYSSEYDIKYVVVDDKSTDGTVEQIKAIPYDIKVIEGTGSLFWNRGMRKAVEYINENETDYDYILFVNDDVEFFENVIDQIVKESKEKNNSVIVGATCDDNQKLTYGAIKYIKNSLKYVTVPVENNKLLCDTFNCNCVLLPTEIFKKVGNFDEHFIHAFGDFDYGLRVRQMGYHIYSSSEYVGICYTNPQKNSWQDRSLSIKKRLELKESPKGLPRAQWFYFLRKHYGLFTALFRTITPYIRIVLKK